MDVNEDHDDEPHEKDVYDSDFWSRNFDSLNEENIFDYALYLIAHDNIKSRTKSFKTKTTLAINWYKVA